MRFCISMHIYLVPKFKLREVRATIHSLCDIPHTYIFNISKPDYEQVGVIIKDASGLTSDMATYLCFN